jgi:hypothetical protein
MVSRNTLSAFYEEIEKDNLTTIRDLQRDMGEMSRIRENFSEDWEIQELTRVIIFEEARIIEELTEEIRYAREARKRLGKV